MAGAVLGIAEGAVVRSAERTRANRSLPIAALAAWVVCLAVGIHNNGPDSGGVLLLFFGVPAAVLWGLGLFAGYRLGAKRKREQKDGGPDN